MVQIAKNPANNLLGSGIHALFSLATVVSGALFLLATAAGGALFLLATSVCCAFFFFGLRPRDFGIHITDPVRGRCSNLPNPTRHAAGIGARALMLCSRSQIQGPQRWEPGPVTTEEMLPSPHAGQHDKSLSLI